MDGMIVESKSTYKCRYCEKSFSKESTLVVHLCEPKRRWQQEKEVGVQLGLKAYLRFYEITQGSAKLKNYEDFVKSSYYNAFIKFGRYSQDIRCINYTNYLEWLLRNNKKIDNWCSDRLYEEWLPGYLQKEAVQDALERALKEMQDYAEANTDLKNGFTDYFRFGQPNRILFHITSGRISPWVVYNSESGVAFLDGLSEEQIQIVLPWIDPEHWQRKFTDYMADTEWVKDILKKAGL
jgi:hypothetical protein